MSALGSEARRRELRPRPGDFGESNSVTVAVLSTVSPSVSGPVGSGAACVAPECRTNLHPGTACGFSLVRQTPLLRSPTHSAQTSGLEKLRLKCIGGVGKAGGTR